MKHYGAEPPWRGESALGRWVRVNPDPRLWFPDDRPYWEWRPERTTTQKLNDVLVTYYLPRIKELLNR